MNKTSMAQQNKTENILSPNQGILQRKCACGNQTFAGGGCAECAKNKNSLQRKLAIGASNDPLEREADRVAEQVMAMPKHSNIGAAPLHIQRLSNQPAGQTVTAPASVDHVIASTGRPLQPALRQDMEQRFGHDFSQVRVHTDARAAESARVVGARAYTVGRHVVFGSGEFAPESDAGKRVLAHELTHDIQQTSQPERLQRLVEVQPDATAANDILGQFNALCPSGNFSIDANNRILSNCSASSVGCDCLCDVTTDQTRAFSIEVHKVSSNPASVTLHDGSTETVPMPSVGPATVGGTHPTVHMPSSTSSALDFGAFRSSGAPFLADNSRILAHEICGHARLNQTSSGSKGNRPGHDVTINTENAIAGSPTRGLFSSLLQGESFHSLPVSDARLVFKLIDGWHHEHVP